jgi:hypothetical protein
MLSVIMREGNCDGCHYAKCSNVSVIMLFVIILDVIMLSVIMMGVIILALVPKFIIAFAPILFHLKISLPFLALFLNHLIKYHFLI